MSAGDSRLRGEAVEGAGRARTPGRVRAGSGRTRSGGPGRAGGGRSSPGSVRTECDTPTAITEIRDHFDRKPEDLIPMLQAVQRGFGYLPESALLEVARLTRLPAATVYGVATFYEQFRLNPVGRHIVKLCRGTACHVRGSDRILNDMQATFNVKPGETMEDGSFTLETVACFGSCALAPVVVLDETVKGRMTPSKTRDALAVLRETADLSTEAGRAAKA